MMSLSSNFNDKSHMFVDDDDDKNHKSIDDHTDKNDKDSEEKNKNNAHQDDNVKRRLRVGRAPLSRLRTPSLVSSLNSSLSNSSPLSAITVFEGDALRVFCLWHMKNSNKFGILAIIDSEISVDLGELAKKAAVSIPIDVNKSPPPPATTKSQEEEDRRSPIVAKKELKLAELGRSPLSKTELESMNRWLTFYKGSSSQTSLQPKGAITGESKDKAMFGPLLCEENNDKGEVEAASAMEGAILEENTSSSEAEEEKGETESDGEEDLEENEGEGEDGDAKPDSPEKRPTVDTKSTQPGDSKVIPGLAHNMLDEMPQRDSVLGEAATQPPLHLLAGIGNLPIFSHPNIVQSMELNYEGVEGDRKMKVGENGRFTKELARKVLGSFIISSHCALLGWTTPEKLDERINFRKNYCGIQE
ncbi:hypothetical protein U1Q18_036121 [Sarracenia purpurea var. burkii]